MSTRSTSSKLNPKQTRFVREYMADLNGTQAAIRAGYSPKTARSIACENLKKPKIADAIHRAADSRPKVAVLAATTAIEALSHVAFRNIPGLFNPNGTLKFPREWPPNIQRDIRAFKKKQNRQSKARPFNKPRKTAAIRSNEKLNALAQLKLYLIIFGPNKF